MFTAMAMPAETAVEEPFWPVATESDRPPAIAKMLDRSSARTRASPVVSNTVLSCSSAEVVPEIVLIDTEPATATAVEPLPLDCEPLLPEAMAPAPPAASVKILLLVRAFTSNTKSPAALPVSTSSVSCTSATVSSVISL